MQYSAYMITNPDRTLFLSIESDLTQVVPLKHPILMNYGTLMWPERDWAEKYIEDIKLMANSTLKAFLETAVVVEVEIEVKFKSV